MGNMLNLAMIIAAVVLLWRGADLLVDLSATMARRLRVSELVIGLTLVGFGTSAPELAVSIGAALNGQGDISVGNIVGSNIFNLGFVLGGCALVRPIEASPKLVYRDGAVLFGVTIVLSLFLEDFRLSFSEGLSMLGVLTIYLTFLFRQKEVGVNEKSADVQAQTKSLMKDVGLLVLSLIAVIAGSELLVMGATGIARSFGLSDWLIGVTIIAAGTSAPELVTSMTAVLKGKYGMSAGSLIGSDIYNLLGVLGVASMINPLQVDPISRMSVYLLVLMVCLALVFMRTGWRVSRKEALVLLTISGFRWWHDISQAIE
jgi:cation:H+ antiporter